MDRLQEENYKLQKQIESSNITFELNLKENTHKIAELIRERNVCLTFITQN